MMVSMRRARTLVLAAVALMLGGCTTPSHEALANNDPFERENRAVYRFDERFDKYVVLPVAGFYLYYMPRPMRRSFHNVFVNFDLPVTFANDVLQGEFSRAGSTFGRFLLNTSVGLGGIVDVATPAGLPYRPADFGQTLGRWGVPEGPFLVLPIIGPDPPRDLVGDAADLSLDPLLYLPPAEAFQWRILTAITLRTASPFEAHARNIVLRQELERGSVDPYATMRSVYRQLRKDEIVEGSESMGEPVVTGHRPGAQ